MNVNGLTKQLLMMFLNITCLGVLVDLHEAGQKTECGELNMETVQQVMAAKWAVDVINNQSLPHELNIGKSNLQFERFQM